MTKCSSISLSDGHRAALEANRACHGGEVLAWKRAQAFILLDKNEDPETICRTLNIDPTVLTEWIRAYSADGFASFGLKDYSQASISLTDDQRADIKAICRRRKVDALVWKRAKAINLLDAKKRSQNYLPGTGHRPNRSDGMVPRLFSKRARVFRSE